MIRRPPRSTPLYSSAASDVYKRQHNGRARCHRLLQVGCRYRRRTARRYGPCAVPQHTRMKQARRRLRRHTPTCHKKRPIRRLPTQNTSHGRVWHSVCRCSRKNPWSGGTAHRVLGMLQEPTRYAVRYEPKRFESLRDPGALSSLSLIHISEPTRPY